MIIADLEKSRLFCAQLNHQYDWRKLSIKYGFQGPNIAIVTACTTGTHNIGIAGRMIQMGDADVMVVGGAEMATTPVGLGGFACSGLIVTK